jgi:hypothetical protein
MIGLIRLGARPLVTRVPDHPADPLGGASSSEDIPGPDHNGRNRFYAKVTNERRIKWDRH